MSRPIRTADAIPDGACFERARDDAWRRHSSLRGYGLEVAPSPKFCEWFEAGWREHAAVAPADVAQLSDSGARNAAKLSAVWHGLEELIFKQTGETCGREPMDWLHLALAELAAYRKADSASSPLPTVPNTPTEVIASPADIAPDAGSLAATIKAQAKFEAFARAEGYPLHRWGPGSRGMAGAYRNRVTAMAWAVWQACGSAMAAPPLAPGSNVPDLLTRARHHLQEHAVEYHHPGQYGLIAELDTAIANFPGSTPTNQADSN